jgi:hypothetical protein
MKWKFDVAATKKKTKRKENNSKRRFGVDAR